MGPRRNANRATAFPDLGRFESVGEILDGYLRRLATRPPGGPATWVIRALACVLPLLALRLLMAPVLGGAGGSTIFLPAVLLATLWGGWRAGVAAAVISQCLAIAASFVPGSAVVDWYRHAVGAGLFTFNVICIIVLSQALRMSIGRVEAARTAEQARAATIAESETRFRNIAENAPVMLWMGDQQGGCMTLNRALRDFWGVSESDLATFDWTSTIHPDDAAEVARIGGEATQSARPFQATMRLRRADGEWRRVHTHAEPRFSASGEFEGMIGVNVDTTETWAAEQRHAFLLRLGDVLRELDTPQEIMRAGTEALGRHLQAPRAGYGEIDKDETTVTIGADWTSGAMKSATGVYLMDDFGPELSRDLKARKTVAVHDLDADRRTAAGAEGFSRIDVKAFVRVPIVRGGRLLAFLFLHSDEPRKWGADEIELAEEVADRLWAAIERATAEAEVRESEARFRSVADSAPVLIWVTRADRRRAFVNQAYMEFHGGDYDEALNADWRAALHPEDVDRVLAESVAGEATRMPFMLEARYRRSDGAWRWLRSYSRPRLDGQELLGFVGVAYDVTEARQVERDLLHINELLEVRVTEALAEKDRAEAALMHAQKMEAVGRLTGGVAHDFNNLLTVVIGALDMVTRAPDDAARRERLLDAALAAARKGERLTHQLLAFSRKQALRPQRVDLNALIREGQPLLLRAVGEAVDLSFDLGAGSASVNIDPSHFEAALLNLIVNARDATADGGAIAVTSRAVTLGQDAVEDVQAGDYVAIQVADSGAGMSEEIRERVFEPFFTTKAVGKGTGLGLSQVYGFVRQSGGAVSIESQPGEGTIVTLYLPAVEAAAEPEPTSAPEEVVDQVERPFEGLSVLLVEDDPEVSEIARDCLQQFGCEVSHALDGAKALRRLRGRRFDLLLTDLIMPGGLNGVELARKVVAKQPDIAVLLASGYAGEAVDQALADVPWPLLPKPYDAAAMRRAIAGALTQREPA